MYNAYLFVNVALVPATGTLAIYNVDAFVNVTPVLVAANVGWSIACIAAFAIVELANATLSVYVLDNNLSPRLPVTVLTLELPETAPLIVMLFMVIPYSPDNEPPEPDPTVRLPPLSTMNLLVPPTCKSNSLLVCVLPESVMFSYIPVNVVLGLFHVCITETGVFVVIVPLLIFAYPAMFTPVLLNVATAGVPATPTVTGPLRPTTTLLDPLKI